MPCPKRVNKTDGWQHASHFKFIYEYMVGPSWLKDGKKGRNAQLGSNLPGDDWGAGGGGADPTFQNLSNYLVNFQHEVQ